MDGRLRPPWSCTSVPAPNPPMLLPTKQPPAAWLRTCQQRGDRLHKTPIREVGAAQVLDRPLGVKLPVIPGTDTVYYTTNISEKLFRPSYGFNLGDPYCRLLDTQYNSLHDPHLRKYYKRKDILRRLKKEGYITSNNKVICSLRELNKYQQYLTSLKLDFERNYSREWEWKIKEMLLLTKIGEDAKREQRVEEQRRRSREESNRKKKAKLEKKKVSHLQKMQDTGLKDDMGRNAFHHKGQNGTLHESSMEKKKKHFDDVKLVYPDGEDRTCKGTSGQASTAVNQSQSSSKNVTKTSGSSVAYQPEVQNSNLEQKTNGITKKTSDERVPLNTSARDSVISAQNSPTTTMRLSHASLGPQKEEKEMQGDRNGRPSIKSSYVGEPEHIQEPQAGDSSSVQFLTIFEGSKNTASSTRPSKENIPETSKNTISKQGSKVLAKESSTLSKVFSQSSGDIPESSPPHQDKH